MKLGTLTFTTDGDKIAAFFTDQDGNSADVLVGRSLDSCTKAISQMVLLMQHRNGIVNYNPDGSVVAGVGDDMRTLVESIANTDKGTGWGLW